MNVAVMSALQSTVFNPTRGMPPRKITSVSSTPIDSSKLSNNNIDQMVLDYLKQINSWKKFPMDAVGVWEVRGESGDGGPPIPIGYFEGRYEDVLRMAVCHPRWSSYGRGGDIEKLPVVKVDSNSVNQLLAAQERLAKAEVEADAARMHAASFGIR